METQDISVKKWYENFKQKIFFKIKYFNGNINCKLLDFRAFTEVLEDNSLIVCGIYDIICYYKTEKTEKDNYQTKNFHKIFVKSIQLNEEDVKKYNDYDVDINVIGSPEIRITRQYWSDFLYKLLPWLPYRIEIEVNGAFCCEVKDKNHKDLKKSSVECKKKLNNKYDIVCIASTRWDFIWQRPQQIMSRISNYENRVLFFDHVCLEQLKRIERESADISKWNRYLKKIYKNLWVFSPEKINNGYRKINNGLDSDRIKEKWLKHFIEKLNFKDVIIITYLPKSIKYIANISKRLLLYDCVDDFTGFSWVEKDTELLEKKLIKSADLVVTTAKNLQKKAKKNNNNSYLIPNGVDFRHFNKASINNFRNNVFFPSYIKKRPVVGFVGALYDWVDEDLLIYIADSRPDWMFIFIGPVQPGIGARLSRRDNVYFMGEIEYRRLPYYIKDFNVCIIPFKINKVTENANPIKMWEYLATGKPIVSTAIPEVLNFKDIIYIARNNHDFLKKIEVALDEKKKISSLKRIMIAKENDWDIRAQKMLNLLNRYYSL